MTRIVCEYGGKDSEGLIYKKECRYDIRDERDTDHFSINSGRYNYNDSNIIAGQSTVQQLHEVLHNLAYQTSSNKPLLTAAEADKFKTAFLDILPENCFRDAGSYGEIHVNVISGYIEILHNQRTVVVQAQTLAYPVGADTATTIQA